MKLLPELDAPPPSLAADAPVADPAEFDTSGWPTADEIEADERRRRAEQEEWDLLVAALEMSSAAAAAQREHDAALREVEVAVEEAAAPITGALPIIVPLTKADAHDGTVASVIAHACDRLREIRRTRRTSELADVVAMLQAVI